jgi:serine/threonine-protein kinase
VGFENRYDEAAGYLRQALTIQERVYGPVHPKVASALNDLGNTALQKDHLDEAEADFRRIVEIYKSVYHDHHYLIATALSNLASVYTARKENARAEPIFREALARYMDTLGPEHSNTAIAHLKLGRALLRQDRFQEAEAETRAGYETLRKQVGPSNNFLRAARKDLTLIYAGLKQPENVRRFEAELESK